MTEATEAYIQSHSKSQTAGIILTLLFGPLGLFYSNWVAALILTVLAVVGSATIIIPILIWILSVVLTYPFVAKHNDKTKTTARLLSGD